MEINIKNFAKVKDAHLICNGLTVLTGKNGSGKSTIGKSIASVFNSFRTCSEYFDVDFFKLCIKRISFVLGTNPVNFRNAIVHSRFANDDKFKSLAFFCQMEGRWPISEQIKMLEEFLKSLEKFDDFENDLFNFYSRNISFSKKRKEANLKSELMDEVVRLIKYGSDPYIAKNYLISNLKDQLDLEFSGQVLPYGNFESLPLISINSDNWSFMFDYNKTSSFRNIAKIQSFADKTFYISDSCIIDNLENRNFARRGSVWLNKDYKTTTVSFNEHLIESLRIKKNNLDSLNKSKLEVSKKLNDVVDYDFIKSNSGYISTKNGINIKNEASGAKIFIILKMLLDRDLISTDSVLIFDEPENHLHPEWQNKFAEIISLISKELGANIICITHSPNMLLALEIYGKKIISENQFHCYYAEIEQAFSTLLDVTDKIEFAHQKLTEPYLFIDSL